MSIQQLLENARGLQDGMSRGGLIREALLPYEQDIVEQQRIQLLEGKGSDGKDLHPFYSEDIKPRGYFRSKDSAARYAAWKQTLSYPYTVKRNADAPNLYITGVFHNDLVADMGTDSMAIVPDTAYAANIMRKYGYEVFGLSKDSWAVIWNDKGAVDTLLNVMRNRLWQ